MELTLGGGFALIFCLCLSAITSPVSAKCHGQWAIQACFGVCSNPFLLNTFSSYGDLGLEDEPIENGNVYAYLDQEINSNYNIDKEITTQESFELALLQSHYIDTLVFSRTVLYDDR